MAKANLLQDLQRYRQAKEQNNTQSKYAALSEFYSYKLTQHFWHTDLIDLFEAINEDDEIKMFIILLQSGKNAVLESEVLTALIEKVARSGDEIKTKKLLKLIKNIPNHIVIQSTIDLIREKNQSNDLDTIDRLFSIPNLLNQEAANKIYYFLHESLDVKSLTKIKPRFLSTYPIRDEVKKTIEAIAELEQHGISEKLLTLLQDGIDVNKLIQSAILANKKPEVTYLLKNVKSIDRNEVMMVLVFNDDIDMWKLVNNQFSINGLIQSDDPYFHNNSPFDSLMRNNKVSLIHSILDSDIDIDMDNISGLLIWAIKNNDLSMAKKVFKNYKIKYNSAVSDLYNLLLKRAVSDAKAKGQDALVAKINALPALNFANGHREILIEAGKMHLHDIVGLLGSLEKPREIIYKLSDEAEKNNDPALSDKLINDMKNKFSVFSEKHEWNTYHKLLHVLVEKSSPEMIDLFMENGISLEILQKVAEQVMASNKIVNINEKLHSLYIPGLYTSYLKNLLDIVYIEQPMSSTDEPVKKSYITQGPIIANNHGYAVSAPKANPNYQEGQQLSLNETAPIGYNIHLPPEGVSIRNVIVQVYGGGGDPHSPGSTNFAHLLEKGVVVISLNLPDLLKLKVHQGSMPEELHVELHACIHKFYQTLKNNPEKLHESLRNVGFQNMNISLMGTSFGGSMAVRHAELYPGTFTSYISHSGFVSHTIDHKASTRRTGVNYNRVLDPAQENEIRKLRDPLLFLQNRDDANVNAKILFDFMERLQNAGKAKLAQLCITEAKDPILPEKESNLQGHGLPYYKDQFELAAQTIVNFTQAGPTALTSRTKREAHKHSKLANKFYRSATVQELFVSEVLERGRVHESERLNIKKLIQDDEAVWNQHYQPFYYAVNFAYKLSNKWPEGVQLLAKEISRLKNERLLTDEVVGNVLALQAKDFTRYLKDKYNVKVTPDFITNNKDLKDKFRNTIYSLSKHPDPVFVRTILKTLYQANPSLLKPKHAEFEKDPALQGSLSLAKTELVKTIKTDKALIRGMWKQTIKQVISQQKSRKAKPYISSRGNKTDTQQAPALPKVNPDPKKPGPV